jgi:hypothetical protein
MPAGACELDANIPPEIRSQVETVLGASKAQLVMLASLRGMTLEQATEEALTLLAPYPKARACVAKKAQELGIIVNGQVV